MSHTGREYQPEPAENKNIDYLALGHVHSFMQDKLDNRGTWCYCGCLEGRGFDECGPKGFVLLDVDEQTCRAQMQFVQMAARTLYTLEVDVSNVMTTREAAERMEEAVNRRSIRREALSNLY